MVRISLKKQAIENIKYSFSSSEKNIPKIHWNGNTFALEVTKIRKLDWADYDKGKLIGYMRGLVELFKLKDEDFK